MMNKWYPTAFALLAALCLSMAAPAPELQAQAVTFAPNAWTAGRFAAARPFQPQLNTQNAAASDGSIPTGTRTVVASQAPTRFSRSLNVTLHAALAAANMSAASASDEMTPNAAGTDGLHYTSSQIVPLSADLAYPHITVGKLFFTAGGYDYVCSASVIRKRVILTAGHCVHSGNGAGSGWYSNFVFVPAFRDGSAPFGVWTGAYAITTTSWYSSGGFVPNARDFAVIVMRDLGGVRLGDRVGSLGWQLYSLAPNHVTMLGYPCNIDGCQKMHRNDAGTSRYRSPNCAEYGSDMGGGSSGGPWVQNFGIPGAGQPAGNSNAGFNLAVGVTSYGPVSPNPKYLGASYLDNVFTSLVNLACSTASNCA